MQITRNILCYGCSFMMLLSSLSLRSQEIRTNDKGENIIVFDDGTWQYFSEQGTGIRRPAEEGGIAVITVDIEPLDGSIPVTQEDIFNISVRQSQLAEEASNIAQIRAEKAIEARDKIEKEFARTLAQGNLTEQEKHNFEVRINAAKQAELQALRESSAAQSEAEYTKEITEKGNFVDAYNELVRIKRKQREIAEAQISSFGASYSDITPMTETYAGGSLFQQVILNPPKKECDFAYEGKEAKTGQWRRDLQKELLFSHTDERLRPFLKDKEYLRCESYFTSVSGFRFLNLMFTFAYPNAREAYGFIEEGSVLSIRLLNGDFINLFSREMGEGKYDTKKEILTYQVLYPIDQSQINLLKQSEVDVIRVYWSSGYEEYEVYHLDFFKNQIDCID